MRTREYPRLAKYGVGYYPRGHAFLTALDKFFFHLRADVEVNGLDNIPTGPYVVVSKHEKYLDTIVQHYVLGESHLHQLARHDFFETWYGFGRWFFTRSACIPIDRFNKNKFLNYEALNYAADCLAAGEPILVYPEKHRHPGHTGHLYVESMVYLDRLARDRGMRVPFVAASQYYEDESVGIPSLLKPGSKVPVRMKYNVPFYLDGLSAEDITARLVDDYEADLGYEYRNDDFDKCEENPIKRK